MTTEENVLNLAELGKQQAITMKELAESTRLALRDLLQEIETIKKRLDNLETRGYIKSSNISHS